MVKEIEQKCILNTIIQLFIHYFKHCLFIIANTVVICYVNNIVEFCAGNNWDITAFEFAFYFCFCLQTGLHLKQFLTMVIITFLTYA